MSPEVSSAPPTAGAAPIRVLAFSCSRYRPLMVRHCIIQMQRQSYRLDHALYMNGAEEDAPDHTSFRYGSLLEDAREPDGGRLFIGYGVSKSSHANYVAALNLVNIDDYDLFLKIDDDDIYYRTYVEDVVADFTAKRWDYSGTHSQGLLNGRRWFPREVVHDLGLLPEDDGLNLPRVMPPTLAMSRRALRVILASADINTFEDVQWRRVVARHPELVMATRNDRNFVYHVHGGNMSTGHWLKP